MKRLLILTSFALATACSTAPSHEQFSIPEDRPPIQNTAPAEKPSVDLPGLQRELGLDGPVENLGYREKSFNSCEVGYGFSRSQGCRRLFMVVVNFQLACRDSEGTISTMLTASDVMPIANRTIKWNLPTAQGTVQTDSQGFGQIVATTASSPKQKRLRLATGPEFLYMRAGEITRVVTPKPWCEQ